MKTGSLLFGVVLIAACNDGSDTGGTAVILTTTTIAATTIAAATAAPTTPASVDPSATTVTSPATTTTPAPLTTSAPPPTTMPAVVGDPGVTSLAIGKFSAPVDLVTRAGDDTAMYVLQQTGQVVRVDPATGDSRTVADVADRIVYGGEQGLLGIVFTPEGGHAYLNYTDGSGDTVVAEYAVAVDGTFDVAGERVLLTIDQPYSNHNGGDLAIGPDGSLYIATGDGGSGNDPERRASDPRSLLGKLLRIDPTPTADAAYQIPPDNPFASGTFGDLPGAPEVFAWGLRNPWRIDFDPVTGELWIADVGQNAFEEVDLAAPIDGLPAGWGLDFGWSAFEGTERFNDDVADPGNTTFPVLVYPHGDDGCSVSGGVVYRGSAIAELAPAYVYSDYCSGKVWALDLAGGRNLTLAEGFSDVSAVARGPGGELYVLELSGTVHALLPAT